MSAARSLWALARADFLERARRYGFLVTLAVTLWAAYGFLPPNHARYATLQLDGHRGLYGSAWVGCLVAMLTAVFLSLAGFYLVKNAVEHDRRSGVGAILAATPLSRWTYVLGKAVSNLMVLGVIAAVVVVGAAGMQLVRGEDPHLDPVRLATPFLLITLPVLALVAALAVLFEVVPGLRGGPGNVVYFGLWIAGLTGGALQHARGGFDLTGFGLVIPSMMRACRRAYPDYDPGAGHMSMGLNFKSSGTWDLKTFPWEGPDWDTGAIAGRLVWVGLALALTGLAALLFDRFDASPVAARARKRGRAPAAVVEPVPRGRLPDVHLTPLTLAPSPRVVPLALAEARLMLSGTALGWWLVTGGLFLASWLAPLEAVRRGILPALWIWPLFHWSPLGNRESVHGTEGLLFAIPRPAVRPLLAQWLAGASVALALAAGVIVRLAATGDLQGAASVCAGAAFVPALAVALGAWSGSPRLFEIVYLLLWYLGPINQAPALDYTGMKGTLGTAAAWTLGAATCVAAAIAGRAARARR